MRRISIRTLLLASALPLLGSASAALAQSNTITILQDGERNTLTVDQSRATESTVGGLTISEPFQQTFFREITKTVESTTPEGGTTSVVERTVIPETVDLVSFSLPEGAAALQNGVNNQAIVTIIGDGGFVGLLQDNDGIGSQGNIARVNLNGNGQAIVGQEGDGNQAGLRVSGLDALGSILQQGSGNTARLNVIGDEALGSITQVGDSNQSTLAVQGFVGTSVSYTLNGNNVTSVNPAQGVEVFTNAQNVTITQTAITGQ